MKTYISLLFLLASALLNCQNFEAEQRQFQYCDGSSTFTTFISADSSWFRQDRLFLDDTLNGDIVLAEPWPSNQFNNNTLAII